MAPKNRAQTRIQFHGKDGDEAQSFIDQIRDWANDNGKDDDDKAIAKYAGTCIRGKAVRWYRSLDSSVKGSWNELEQAILEKWPEGAEDDDEESSDKSDSDEEEEEDEDEDEDEGGDGDGTDKEGSDDNRLAVTRYKKRSRRSSSPSQSLTNSFAAGLGISRAPTTQQKARVGRLRVSSNTQGDLYIGMYPTEAGIFTLTQRDTQALKVEYLPATSGNSGGVLKLQNAPNTDGWLAVSWLNSSGYVSDIKRGSFSEGSLVGLTYIHGMTAVSSDGVMVGPGRPSPYRLYERMWNVLADGTIRGIYDVNGISVGLELFCWFTQSSWGARMTADYQYWRTYYAARGNTLAGSMSSVDSARLIFEDDP